MRGDVRRSGADTRRLRYALAVVGAILLSLVAAVPVFAQEEPAPGEDQPVQPQVVGGSAVPDGKYRFVTSIQADLSGREPYREHFCGGSLIDRDSVLTAAHCVVFIGRETNERTLGYEDVRLDVGVTLLNSEQGQRRRIGMLSDISIHPRYNGRENSKYDVAVVELKRPVKNIAPIRLASVESGNKLEEPPADATVAGWGDTRPQPPVGAAPSNFPKRMREATPPLVSDGQCKASYEATGEPGLEVYPALMVCAGQTAEDTCQGDSGGPMFVTANGARRQIGITSYGLGCGATGFPGVYTEVNAPSIHGFIRKAASTGGE